MEQIYKCHCGIYHMQTEVCHKCGTSLELFKSFEEFEANASKFKLRLIKDEETS